MIFTFAQIEQLWISNGGSAALAPIMAAIALAESGGDSEVLNDDPATGDYSVGLWQINYYGDLWAPRSARYGSPDVLRADPNRQARAAIDLAAGGAGLGNWTTYRDGAYRGYLESTPPATGGLPSAGGAVRPGGGGQAQDVGFFGDAWGAVEGVFKDLWHVASQAAGGVSSFFQAVIFFVHWITDPLNWIRMVEFAVGVALIAVGLNFFSHQLRDTSTAALSTILTRTKGGFTAEGG